MSFTVPLHQAVTHSLHYVQSKSKLTMPNTARRLPNAKKLIHGTRSFFIKQDHSQATILP